LLLLQEFVCILHRAPPESCGIALVCEAYIFIYFPSTRSALVSESRRILSGEVMKWGERGFWCHQMLALAQARGGVVNASSDRCPDYNDIITGVRVLRGIEASGISTKNQWTMRLPFSSSFIAANKSDICIPESSN